MPQFIEVAHELSHPYPLLLDDSAQTCEQVIEVVGGLVPDGGFAFPRFVSEVLESIRVCFGKCVAHFVVAVHVADEFVVVDVGQVAPIHVLLEHEVQQFFGGRDQLELFEDSAELVLGHVSDFGDIEVFELRFQVQSLGGDRVPESLQHFREGGLFAGGEVEG